jgi:predicted transposase YbfD/YdcC
MVAAYAATTGNEKSPYTGGHCQRVPELAMMLADAVDATSEGPLAEFKLTDKDRYELADAVRGHWGVENGLHWHLDVTFGEDARTVKKDHGPENVSLMNKIVLALLKLAPPPKSSRKISLRRRRLMAAWDDDSRMELLRMRRLSEQVRPMEAEE